MYDLRHSLPTGARHCAMVCTHYSQKRERVRSADRCSGGLSACVHVRQASGIGLDLRRDCVASITAQKHNQHCRDCSGRLTSVRPPASQLRGVAARRWRGPQPAGRWADASSLPLMSIHLILSGAPTPTQPNPPTQATVTL